MRILLADDNEADRLLEKAMLQKLGFEDIHEAADGMEAWRKILTAVDTGLAYQLIVTDWKMPLMSGVELLRRLRGEKKLKHLPVILLTGVAETHLVKSALERGVTDYIIKPVKLETLKEKINKILKDGEDP